MTPVFVNNLYTRKEIRMTVFKTEMLILPSVWSKCAPVWESALQFSGPLRHGQSSEDDMEGNLSPSICHFPDKRHIRTTFDC